MKIMFCIACLHYGGAEKNMCLLANELVNRGHKVSICNFNHLPTTQKIDNRIKVYDVPQYNKRIVKRLQQISYMCKLFKKEKPDILVSFLFMPNFLTAIIGKILGIPTIISERGDPYRHKSKTMKFIYHFYNWASGAVFQSYGAQAFFSKKLQERSCVIPNPVALKAGIMVAEWEKRKKTIAFVARFEVAQKRQDIMLKAFRIVQNKHPDYSLDFYGDGSDEEKMKELTRSLGLSESVRFNGVVNKVEEKISHSRLFVLSSDFEGIPNSLMEAMSIGLPCVSTDCSPGGARMLIENEENGLLVPCGNPEELAKAINRMIEDEQFAERCGAAAVRVKDKYAIDKIMDAWENYIIEVSHKRKN